MTKLNHKDVGDLVPDTVFPIREKGEWKQLTSSEIFYGRTVVIFALPGAFTPTCSKSHLPGYSEFASEIKAYGVDDIYCLSVNDWFVMDAWRETLGVVDDVLMLPDGNTDFTREMGMLVPKQHLGFGDRSWRYSMLVRSSLIEGLFIEDTKDTGDPFAVSDARTMLKYLSSIET